MREIVGHDTNLIINHRLDTTGTGLVRLSGAGHTEWCDRWILLAHRQQLDVAAGRFHIGVDIGSRQWGGASYQLDLNIGTMSLDTGMHDGPITWDLSLAAAPAEHPRNHVESLSLAEPLRAVGPCSHAGDGDHAESRD